MAESAQVCLFLLLKLDLCQWGPNANHPKADSTPTKPPHLVLGLKTILLDGNF